VIPEGSTSKRFVCPQCRSIINLGEEGVAKSASPGEEKAVRPTEVPADEEPPKFRIRLAEEPVQEPGPARGEPPVPEGETQKVKARRSPAAPAGAPAEQTGALAAPAKPDAARPPEVDDKDMEAVQQLAQSYGVVRRELAKVIVGQNKVVEELLVAMFCQGHCLLVGVPGLAKTLLIRTLAEILSLSFKRIQFTPDLMPSDITGTEIIQEDPITRDRKFKFLRGPIFANIVLADEINRTPPKTQAALLEAMQEHRVTVGDQSYTLEEPFFVLATQNPIEQEGTYPLPEAQLDRFMFMVLVDYPTRDEELDIMKSTTTLYKATLQKVLGAKEIIELQRIVRKVPVADHIYEFAADLARSTRPKAEDALPFVKDYVSWGAGPRAAQYLILGSKARAILSGRYYVASEDVEAVAHPVLRHRVLTNYNAESEGITSDMIIDQLVQTVKKRQSSKLF